MSGYPSVSHLPNALHQLLEHQAQSQPDKEFLRLDGRCWTFRELDQHALLIAHAHDESQESRVARRGLYRSDMGLRESQH